MNYTIVNNLVFSKNESVPSQFNLDNSQDVKKSLMKIIRAIINRDKGDLTQTVIAEILGTTQPNISRINNIKIFGFSFAYLFLFLLRLGCDIKLIVNSKLAKHEIQIKADTQEIRVELMIIIADIIK